MLQMIDHARLSAMAHGSAAVQAQIVADFRRMNTQDAVLLRQAALDADFRQVSILAHRIKGASMMLGAVHFAEVCSLVSMAGRASDGAAVDGALVFLEREMAQLDEHLGSICDGELPPPDIVPGGVPPKLPMLCSKLRFLVVEDHAFQRDLIMKFLLRLGAAQVRGFADGGAALAALNSPGAEPADIMVLDLSMPGVDGMDLMRTLSGSGNPVSLILNSALSPSLMASLVQIARRHRLNLLGAVSKPLSESNLAPLIAKYHAGQPLPPSTS